MNALSIAFLMTAMMGSANIVHTPEIDRAFNRIYNFDFAGVNVVLDEYVRVHPEDPMSYATRALGCLFSEMYRMQILATEFFTDDDKVTDKKNVKPDPAMRAQLFQMTGEARKRAQIVLASDPNNRNALTAMCTSSEVETDYTILIDKKYIRSFSMSKESQRHARKLLAMDPPDMDAHLTLGMVEYVVSNMNWFYRLFIHFNQIEGSKTKAIDNLKDVLREGHYYTPLAKILLSVIYLRENQPHQALTLMRELERDFPENQLIHFEIRKISERIAKGTTMKN
jgi:hypothetical protein